MLERLPGNVKRAIRDSFRRCRPRYHRAPEPGRGRVGSWRRLNEALDLDLAASIVQVTTNSDFSGGGTSFSPTAAFTSIGAGDAIVTWFSYDYSPGQVTVSAADGTNTYSAQQNVCLDTGDTQALLMHFAVNCASGSNVTPTLSWTGSRQARAIEAVQITGCGTNAIGSGEHAGQFQSAPGTGTDGVTTGTITPAATGILVVLSFDTNATHNAPTAGTGFTSQATGWAIGGNDKMRLEFKTGFSSAGSGTFTALGNEAHCTIGITIRDSGGGGGPTADSHWWFAAFGSGGL